MRRRDFITLIGGAAAAGSPLAARAQDRMRHVGVLMGYAESDKSDRTSSRPDVYQLILGFRILRVHQTSENACMRN